VVTHQGDPLAKLLFALAHFCAFSKPFQLFFLCVSSFHWQMIHILGPTSFIPFVFDHFASQLVLMDLVILPRKGTTWSPFNLPSNFTPLHGFCYPPDNINVLKVPLILCHSFLPFVRCFG